MMYKPSAEKRRLVNTNKGASLEKPKREPRARILLRVSSHAQRESDGDLNVQRQIILEHLKEQHPGWILDAKEYFEGGVSGYKNSVAQRDALQEALTDAQNGEYDILAVYKDDRLGRRMLEIPEYVMKLKAAGIMVYTVKDGFLTPKSNDPMEIFSLILRYTMAQKSSADTGMRVKDTAKRLITQGKYMGGNPPYGYRLELSGEVSKHGRALKHLTICPEQAEAVKQIYHLSLMKEYGSVKIANSLNTDDRYKRLAPHDVWKSGTVASILTNPIYAGYTAYNRRERLNGRYRSLDSKEWILATKANPDIVIIDEETWTKVQEKRRQRRLHDTAPGNQGVTGLKRNDGMLSLIDVLHCGCCGYKMVNGSRYNYWTLKSTGERRTSKIPIYKCQRARQGVPHNQVGQFRADRIEPVIYSMLAKLIGYLLEGEDIRAAIAKSRNQEIQRQKANYETEWKKLEKINRRICVMEEHIPDAMIGDYPISLKDLAQKIKKQKDMAREQIAIVQQQKADLQNLSLISTNRKDDSTEAPTWQELFLLADVHAKRVLVNKLIRRIDITERQIIVRLKISLHLLSPQVQNALFSPTQKESPLPSRMDNNGVVPKQGL